MGDAAFAVAGKQVESGLRFERYNDVDGDGVYAPAVDTEHVVQKVCNGSDGNPSQLTVTLKSLSAGSAGCPMGGALVERFEDANLNRSYDSDVDRDYKSVKICSGSNAVLRVETLQAAGTECPGVGGLRFESFTDGNGNGTWEAASDSERSLRFSCHPARREIVMESLDPGDPICTAGGKLLRLFTDTNGNGVYDIGPDTDYSESRVCNGMSQNGGASAVVTRSAIPVGDARCASGGYLIVAFTDINGNRAYDVGMDENHMSEAVCHGATGKRSVALQTPLAVGNANCPAGGVLFESFLDVNGNDTYESNSDLLYVSNKICAGKSTVLGTNPVASGDSTCPAGGVEFISFTDLNGNGVYDGSVDTGFSTRKLCHGSVGPAGATGATGAVLYVDAALGSDANACIVSGVGACQAIMAAVNKIPYHVAHAVTLNIQAGTYREAVNLGPFVFHGDSVFRAEGVGGVATLDGEGSRIWGFVVRGLSGEGRLEIGNLAADNHTGAGFGVDDVAAEVRVVNPISASNADTAINFWTRRSNVTIMAATTLSGGRGGLHLLGSSFSHAQGLLSVTLSKGNGIVVDEGSSLVSVAQILSNAHEACGLYVLGGSKADIRGAGSTFGSDAAPNGTLLARNAIVVDSARASFIGTAASPILARSIRGTGYYFSNSVGTLRYVTASNNVDGNGILCSYSSRCIVENATANGNTFNGMVIERHSNGDLGGALVAQANGHSGIAVTDATVVAAGADINTSNNAYSGFTVTRGRAWVSGNTFTSNGNGQYGLVSNMQSILDIMLRANGSIQNNGLEGLYSGYWSILHNVVNGEWPGSITCAGNKGPASGRLVDATSYIWGPAGFQNCD